jgi:DNA topoisomerase VI subunit B
MDFCSRKELIAQTGHQPEAWPLVVLKEAADNSIDACEDQGIRPLIFVTVDARGIEIADNGPGIPEATVESICDFSVRVSSREAYVSPTRGAQGNALKTLIAMPFVLSDQAGEGRLDITAHGIRHEITLHVDRIRQEPVIERRRQSAERIQSGTVLRVHWPDSSCSILQRAKHRFVQMLGDYTFLNPHLSLIGDWFGERWRVDATSPAWPKWRPSDATSPHWYGVEQFERLIGAFIAHDADGSTDRTVRQFVSAFAGLSRPDKQAKVLKETGLARVNLSALRDGDSLNHELTRKLLAVMKNHSKVIKPAALGVLGKTHLSERFSALGCDMETFNYRKVADVTEEGLPFVLETAFAWSPDAEGRRIITGVNWSPGILNPFRELGRFGQSLDSILERQRAGEDEPVVFLLHVACPRVEYTDRGKSAVVIGGEQHSDEEE